MPQQAQQHKSQVSPRTEVYQKVFISPRLLERDISFRSFEYEVVCSRALAYATMWARAVVCMPPLSFRKALSGFELGSSRDVAISQGLLFS
jgi:hypothetical protein